MPISIKSKQRRVELLSLLNNSGFLSGEKLASHLGISRTMLWKEIESLKKQGFEITGVTSNGYKLSDVPVLLSADYIASRVLELKNIGPQIITFDAVDSTHTEAKRLSASAKNNGTVLIAKAQTAGRGRLGRSWSSPEGGIWMSIILSPGLPIIDIYKIGLAGALSGAETIEDYGSRAWVKWPNDIMIDDRKAGGILLEASGEAECVTSLVLSIGINVNFPSSTITGSAPNAITVMDKLSANINLNEACVSLLKLIDHKLSYIYSDRWELIFSSLKDYDYLKGKTVKIELPENKELIGEYSGIAENGCLKIKTAGGKDEQLSMGEIVKVYYED